MCHPIMSHTVVCLADSLPGDILGGPSLMWWWKYCWADDGPGTLREGCRKSEPLWIVFEVSGTITLSSYCRVQSYKTIDGRGQCVRITGKGLQLKQCEHVIICNLILDGGRGHDVDGIQMKPNVKHVWVDRCSISDFDDGCIDITRESTDITVSR